MSNQIITIKLNRFTSYLQQPTYKTQSPSPSPTDNFFTIILFHLQQWLNFIPDLFTAFLDKLNNIFPPETREQWLNAAVHWLPFVAAGALLLCFLCCCLPAVLSCISWVLVTIFILIKGFFVLLFNIVKGFFVLLFNIVKGFFVLLCNACKSVFTCLCCCGQSSVKMMIAPGTNGLLTIPRAIFEANPAGYFRLLRA